MPDILQSPARSRRRWFRYSLRGLLIAVTAIAVWLGIAVNQIRSQREAVRQVQAAGGTVMYDYHEVAPRTVSTNGRPRGPQWLRRLFGPELFDRPVWINLLPPRNETWATAVHNLPSTRYLLLSGRTITDEQLGELTSLQNLLELQLEGVYITDAGMKPIGELSNLKWLRISGPNITDAGVACLSKLDNLEELSLLGSSGISNRSVSILSRFHKLRRLNLRGTGITDVGFLRELQSALPNCIIRDPIGYFPQ